MVGRITLLRSAASIVQPAGRLAFRNVSDRTGYINSFVGMVRPR